jgi:hypothetical protein
MVRTSTAAIATALAAVIGGRAARAQSAKLEVNELPPHVAAAARAVGGFERITEAGVEVEGGQLIFEVRGRTREGRVREADSPASGEVEEIEDEI